MRLPSAIKEITKRENALASAYQFFQVQYSYKPIVLLSLSVVLRVVSCLAYLSGFSSYKPLVLRKSRIIDMVVKTSVS